MKSNKFDKSIVWNGENFIIDASSVHRFNNWYSVNERYIFDEGLLCKYVPALITQNSTKSDIYHVITLINSFFSTRMGADDCYQLAEVLYQEHPNVLDALNTGNPNTVQTIVKKAKGFDRVPFSFLTKYFSILSRQINNADKFPIYDSVVSRILDFYFYQTDKTSKTPVSRLHKNYVPYYECIKTLINDTDIEYKQLDTYLWGLGRNVIYEYEKNKKNSPKLFRATSKPEIIDNLLTNLCKKNNWR